MAVLAAMSAGTWVSRAKGAARTLPPVGILGVDQFRMFASSWTTFYRAVQTGDAALLARVVKDAQGCKGALAIRPNGKPFTETSIGDALATRELMNSLRETGTMTGGPAPFNKQDRSRFLSALDTMVHQAKRRRLLGR